MSQETIYGKYQAYLSQILEHFSQKIQDENQRVKKDTGFKLFEHFLARIKTNESMIEKCQRKQLPLTAQSALKEIRDAIGIRIVCGFVDDIYKMVLISSISFSAVLGNMVREYLSLNLIFLIFLINMGAIFLRMYLSKKKNKFIL